MELLDIIAILMTITALFGWLNYRFLKLPSTIGLMLITLVGSLALICANRFGLNIEDRIQALIQSIDFKKVLMEGMLGFLLFASALHVKIDDLLERKWTIGILSTLGVIFSTFMIGSLIYIILGWIDLRIDYIYCLLFGALISPTDPIAVQGILKKARVPHGIETKLTGESLFNDGIGVVVFITLLGFVDVSHETGFGSVAALFVKEAFGGILFGLITGMIAYYLLKSVDNYQVEILTTLALVAGGYTFANHLHVSGPLAMVVSGLLIGNRGRRLAMSERTVEHLDMFWKLIDDILNALLFVLIGLEVLILNLTGRFLLAGFLAVPITLLARFISVAVPIGLLRQKRDYSPHAIRLLTWGGLRGGIAVALVLSLPRGSERDILLTVTYVVVAFSILVQGLTLRFLVKKDHKPLSIKDS